MFPFIHSLFLPQVDSEDPLQTNYRITSTLSDHTENGKSYRVMCADDLTTFPTRTVVLKELPSEQQLDQELAAFRDLSGDGCVRLLTFIRRPSKAQFIVVMERASSTLADPEVRAMMLQNTAMLTGVAFSLVSALNLIHCKVCAFVALLSSLFLSLLKICAFCCFVFYLLLYNGIGLCAQRSEARECWSVSSCRHSKAAGSGQRVQSAAACASEAHTVVCCS